MAALEALNLTLPDLGSIHPFTSPFDIFDSFFGVSGGVVPYNNILAFLLGGNDGTYDFSIQYNGALQYWAQMPQPALFFSYTWYARVYLWLVEQAFLGMKLETPWLDWPFAVLFLCWTLIISPWSTYCMSANATISMAEQPGRTDEESTKSHEAGEAHQWTIAIGILYIVLHDALLYMLTWDYWWTTQSLAFLIANVILAPLHAVWIQSLITRDVHFTYQVCWVSALSVLPRIAVTIINTEQFIYIASVMKRTPDVPTQLHIRFAALVFLVWVIYHLRWPNSIVALLSDAFRLLLVFTSAGSLLQWNYHLMWLSARLLGGLAMLWSFVPILMILTRVEVGILPDCGTTLPILRQQPWPISWALKLDHRQLWHATWQYGAALGIVLLAVRP